MPPPVAVEGQRERAAGHAGAEHQGERRDAGADELGHPARLRAGARRLLAGWRPRAATGCPGAGWLLVRAGVRRVLPVPAPGWPATGPRRTAGRRVAGLARRRAGPGGRLPASRAVPEPRLTGGWPERRVLRRRTGRPASAAGGAVRRLAGDRPDAVGAYGGGRARSACGGGLPAAPASRPEPARRRGGGVGLRRARRGAARRWGATARRRRGPADRCGSVSYSVMPTAFPVRTVTSLESAWKFSESHSPGRRVGLGQQRQPDPEGRPAARASSATSTVPWWAATSAATMARPRPVLVAARSARRVRAASAR